MKLDREILNLTKDDDLEGEIQQADEFKGNLVKLDKRKRDPTPAAAAVPTIRDHDNRVKLPKFTIQLDVTKWTPFWDSYDLVIHQSSSLTWSD